MEHFLLHNTCEKSVSKAKWEGFGRICLTSDGSTDLQRDSLVGWLDAIHRVEIEGDGTQFDRHAGVNTFDHETIISLPGWTLR